MSQSKAMRRRGFRRHKSLTRATRNGAAAKSFRRNQDGIAAVEMALVLPFLLMLLAGIIDFGAMFFLQNNMISAARGSARALAFQSVTATEAEQMAQDSLVNWSATFTVNAEEPDPSDPTDTDVVVTITVPIADAAPVGLVADIIGITGTMEARIAMPQEG